MNIIVDTESRAYKAGYDCGLNGANMDNSHFAYFSSREGTLLWSAGKTQAEADKQNPDHKNWQDPMDHAAWEGGNQKL